MEKRQAIGGALLLGGVAAGVLAYVFRDRGPRRQQVAVRTVSLPQLTQAYQTNGGMPVLGRPTSPAAPTKDRIGYKQTFEGSGGYPAAIFVTRGGPAYVVRGGFYSAFTNFPAIGWPLEDEHPIRSGPDAGIKQIQKFTNGEMRWNRRTGQLMVKVGQAIVYDSGRPPQRKRDAPWYEDAWDFTKSNAGTIVAVGEGIALLPAAIGAVGIGVVFAPVSGGSTLLAAGGVVAGMYVTVTEEKKQIDNLTGASAEPDYSGPPTASDLF